MQIIVRCLAAGLLVLLAPPAASAVTWNIDPDHSNIQFQVSHLGLANVKGSFRTFRGSVDLDSQDITRSKVHVTIEAASIDTGVAKRDEHLRSPDFFDAAKYPTLTFVSKQVAPAGKGQLKVTGDLTIRGVTRETVLHVNGPTPELQDPWGQTRRGLSAAAVINRQDFGLTYNQTLENGVLAIGNQVTINLEVELLKPKDN